MKRTLVIILAALIMISIFTACGSTGNEEPSPAIDTSAGPAPSENADASKYADLPDVKWTYTSAVGE